MKIASLYIVAIFVLLFAFHSFANDNFSKYTMKTVVIDAGHGGKDPGTLGAVGQEKNVVLPVALKFGKMIESKFPEIKVIYTRTTDEFIGLNERANIANKNKADLFISIHCNSACYVNGKTKKITCKNEVNGTEVYVMGLNMSQGNLDVAKRENEVILMEDNYTAHYEGFDPNSPQSHIVFSLYQNAFLEQSIAFASKVVKNAEGKSDRANRGVKQAGFIVLWKTSMPSVLIETGYITNRAEEQFLLSDDGQNSLANSIFTSFKEYKDEMEGNVAKTKEVQYASTDNAVPVKEIVTENPTPPVIIEKVKPEEKIEKPKPEVITLPKMEVKIEKPKDEIIVPVKPEEKIKIEIPVIEKPKIEKTEVSEVIVKKEETKKIISTEEKPVVVFRVQFMVSDKVLNLKTTPYSNYKDIEMEKVNIIYKYTVGNFTSLEQATMKQNEMRKSGFKDAFVVAYNNGNRIPMPEAMKLLKK